MAEKEETLTVTAGLPGESGILAIRPFQHHPHSEDKSTRYVIDGADAMYDFLSSKLTLEHFARLVFTYLDKRKMAGRYKGVEHFIDTVMLHSPKF